VSISDYPALEKVSDMAIKEKQKFERLVVSKEKLLEMFAVRIHGCFLARDDTN
jgi:threonyl-tRNA synthetase